MLIHCPHCIARVNAEVKGAVQRCESESELTRISLSECPACGRAIVGQDELLQSGGYGDPNIWSVAIRVWPQPDIDVPVSIPALIRASLVEANLCLRAGAFTASVAMTGRALEAMCHHFQTKGRTLAQRVKELLDREIIDKRLFQWSEALRLHRNLAAHASGEQFVHDDAEDLFNFATAICDYVFVLNEKFAQFMKRREGPKALQSGEPEVS